MSFQVRMILPPTGNGEASFQSRNRGTCRFKIIVVCRQVRMHGFQSRNRGTCRFKCHNGNFQRDPLLFQSRNRGTCRFKERLPAFRKTCRTYSFNLVIEVLVVSSMLVSLWLLILDRFNLVIEVLVVSRHNQKNTTILKCALSFNLVIEVLVVSSENIRQNPSVFVHIVSIS